MQGDANELAQRLELLSLDDSKEPKESKEPDSCIKIDLTSFVSVALLDQLQAFTVYLEQVDAINLGKVMVIFTSHGDFASFKAKVDKLYHLHPSYSQAMEALSSKVVEKFKVLVLIDLGGTVFFRTD